MRRASSFYTPTLLLSLVTQFLYASVLWFFYLVIATQGYAATSITPTSGAGSLGTTVTQSGNVYGITGGKTAGTNLFHSFGQFGVATGDTAQFQTSNLTPNASMSNILGRVTGGSPSTIFGAIDSATFYPSANLFLMNPAGFLFGPNATVNVGGMMHATTADYLRLADGHLFKTATDIAADAMLTTSPVAAFGFLGSNPAAISIQGSTLQVAEGKSLSFVGGNQGFTATDPDSGNPIAVPGGITITGGTLSAPGGQINIASVASPGEILAENLAQAPNSNGQSFGALGAIQVLEQSVIDVSGNGGGTVLIRGGNLILDNSTISSNVTSPGPIVNGTESIGKGIDIQVSGNAVLQNLGVLQTNVGNATPGATYGGAHVKADSIEIIGTVTLDDFFSGNVDFSAPPFTGIRSDVLPGSTGGNSGNIVLEANSIAMSNFGQLETQVGCVASSSCQSDEGGAGNAGSIKLTANQNLDLADLATIQIATSNSTGNVGNIELTSVNGNITITNLSQVVANTALGSGNIGEITVSAPHGNILLANGANIGSGSFEGGAIGGFKFTANNLQLNGGSQITYNNRSNSQNPPGDLTVTLSGNLSLNDGSAIFTNAFSATPAANVDITAHDVSVAGGSFITTGSQQVGQGGELNISANTVQVTTGGQIRSGSTVFPQFDFATFTFVPVFPSGSGGTINIQGHSGPTSSILIDGADSGIFTNSQGSGSGGTTNILAQSVTIQNGGAISAQANGSGTGGQVNISTGNLQLTNGGHITSGSVIAVLADFPFAGQPLPPPSGPAGTITIQGLADPAGSIMIDGAGSGIFTNAEGTGPGGNASISAQSLTIQNGGAISAATSGTSSSATGGIITVNAEHVAVNGQGVITADTNGIAPGGTVDINTGTLAINSGGQIRSSSGAETEQVSAFALFSTAAPSLTGGTITVQGRTGTGSQADSVTIDGAGSGVFTESTGTRPGGDINILASQSVAMTNGAQISASSTGTGNAGNIQINAGNQLAMQNSSITTEANQASGGAIKITTTPAGSVQLTDSTITASVLDGTGGGGSVDIDPQFVILQNSQILAQAFQGPGGNISITTNLLLPDTTSVISASSQFGQQGNIIIQSPVSPASGKLVPLGQKPLVATALVSQRCAALARGNASSFTMAGRDSLPAEPGGWVSSPLALRIAESADGTLTEKGTHTSQNQAAEEAPLLSLRKIAPPGFLTQNFAANSSDCQS